MATLECLVCKDCDNKGLCSLEQIITCAEASTDSDVWLALHGEALDRWLNGNGWMTLSPDEDIPC